MAVKVTEKTTAYGYANDWKVKPEAVEICQRSGHNVFQFALTDTSHEIWCAECDYRYRVEHYRPFVVPGITASPLRYVSPDERPAPAPAPAAAVTRGEITEIVRSEVRAALAAAGILTREETIRRDRGIPPAPAPVPPVDPVPPVEQAQTPAEEAEDQAIHHEGIPVEPAKTYPGLEAAHAAKVARREAGHVLT